MVAESETTPKTSGSGDKVTVTTPNGTVVVIKGFVSGGDFEDMQRVFLESVIYKVDPETGLIDQTNQEVPGTIVLDSTKRALELLLIQVGDETTNLYDAARALPVADYEFITTEVNKITGPLVQKPSTS